MEQRRAIRHLLDDLNPADASAVYFAFHYPDTKTQLVTYPTQTDQAVGYIAFSRTGIDLFRPFVTLRLPIHDLTASADLIYTTIMPDMPLILDVPALYMPLIRALFTIHSEEKLCLYTLNRYHFEPILNVLVVQETSVNGFPRFVIRQRTTAGTEETMATAGLNWLSPYFGEISVNTNPNYRRQGFGRSVVSAMSQYILDRGIIPLYLVAENNEASIKLAETIGFLDSGSRSYLLQASLNSRP